MVSRRLFFALWPDDDLRRRLAAATRPGVAAAGGQPLEPAGWHLTLVFLGAVPEERIPAVRTAAASVTLDACPLALDRYGHFPRAQVFWLGPAAVPPALPALVMALRDRLAALGLGSPPDPDGPGFQPHLTLCRKVRRQPDVPPPEPLHWTPRGFVLVESRPGPGGSRYEILGRFPPDPGHAVSP